MMSPAQFAIAAPPTAPGFAARIAERWRLWRERRRWIAEMANAASLGSLDATLNDVGITRAELGTLTAAPPDAGRQFETMAEMAQIDLHHLDPAELREAMWVCSRCECRTPCKRWLATGVWRGGADTRCPNAALLHH